MPNTKNTALILSVLIMSSLAGYLAFAWHDPTASPPGGNVPAPLNTGDVLQIRTGHLLLQGVFETQTYVHLATNSGHVGIGTTGPTQKLDIAGQIRVRGGNPAAGKVLTSIDDGGTASWQTFTGALPPGTSGQTIRHDGSGWIGSNLLFNNETNIGIGTTQMNSWTRLHVEGGEGWGEIHVSSPNWNAWGWGGSGINFGSKGSGYSGSLFEVGAGRTTADASDRHFWIADKRVNATRLYISANGNVGIGTESPGQKLDVIGYVRGSQGLCLGNDCREVWPTSSILPNQKFIAGSYDPAGQCLNHESVWVSYPSSFSNRTIAIMESVKQGALTDPRYWNETKDGFRLGSTTGPTACASGIFYYVAFGE